MGKARILVVDDAKFSRELLRLHLSNAGYEVETAEDAIDAGRRVLRDPPHLIITDVNMPYMSGTEFIAALRADDEVPDIPVIFLSANESKDGEERQLRAAAWLRKPVSAERLLEVVALQVPM
jgi:CheY-like chemotaxis protein